MREIRTSGLMSGDGKRGNAPPRPSSTLQVMGKKRHILVDTLGLLLHAIGLAGSAVGSWAAQR
jgi:hypothetical protein